MKIDKKIREAFDEQMRVNEQLKNEVDVLLRGRHEKWHYESRLKEAESFALKVEGGRCADDLTIDDFFASTIVVPNVSQINEAVAFVSNTFDVIHARPPAGLPTRTRPTDFVFDGLRIYARVRAASYATRPVFANTEFEVQIKTYLEHAWGVATHDLTYKSGSISWARMRMAYSIKAMLEHIDMSLERVDDLAKAGGLQREYAEYIALGNIVEVLQKYWEKEQLPRKDSVGLAKNISAVLSTLRIDLGALDGALGAAAARGVGPKLQNLSPYGAVLQTVVSEFGDKVAAFKKEKPRRQIVISPDVEWPSALGDRDADHFRVL